MMEIFETKKQLQTHLADLRQAGKKIALVPTMGALHEGHLSLISEAQKVADIVVCSIFVNPTQFNDPKDLEKYPRPIENDIKLLTSAKCDILFMPTVAEMYPADETPWHINLGALDSIWEGEKRPGHFQGVTQVVYKLFMLTLPDVACFGQKDFQQIMVIQKMIDIKQLPVTIHICPIVRSPEGLALSSRNMRLSEADKIKALALYRSLNTIKKGFPQTAIAQLEENAEQVLADEGEITLEYLAICESTTLSPATTIEPGKSYVALLVAWVAGVRLIDNMILS
ncbi:pantoate--beta-alanine ligase [Sphingobacterium psychroaquaticum]|uniref:Pantothenate synthetase n=1 Tax=Sphingobacterium psychroaquaticum TaxID=561061 RepID=A0A1X7K1Q6_9SPHI|nr:pantoate--beta-alanine ligase [Sphingobacterium psychroaquaticum]SMG34616.1 pantoate--beta-alanine ligase [Sphingobacterium psychroaquaticum]